MPKDMLDQDFLDEEGFDEASPKQEKKFRDDDPPRKSPAQEDDIEVVVKDDTPPEDKGKWVADDERDGPPEDLHEDEVDQYSKDVKARISKLTARMHAERRAREQAARQLNELARFAQEQIAKNNQLSALVENGEKVLLNEHKGRLESQMMQARNAYKIAYENGDVEGMTASQEQIARVAAAMDRAAVHRPTPVQRTSEQELQRRIQPQVPSESVERAKRWAQENPWFQRDPAMTAYASELHKDIVTRQGIDPNTEEYWERLDGDLRKRFPDRFQMERKPNARDEKPRRTSVAVAPARREGDRTVQRVTLTASQVSLAKKLGLTPQQYAREVLRAQEDGEI